MSTFKQIRQGKRDKLAPDRHQYAKSKIIELGYHIYHEDGQKLMFAFEGFPVSVWPYTGWHSGRTIKDGRGIHKLLKQIKK